MKAKGSKKISSKLEVPVGAVYALLAALSLICITIMAVVIAGGHGGSGEEFEEEPEFMPTPHLYIEEVFFQGRESAEITVEIYIYMTNDGSAAADNVIVHIWPVVGESNIATDMQEVDFGTIGINETSMQKISIVLKAGETLSVELLVFESKMMVLKGRAEVSTSGQGGGNYQNTEVRGTSGDKDYDGMPDDWERYYHLDPSDPSDADLDNDGDGVSNLMEYRLNRNPTSRPASSWDDVAADDDDDESIADWTGENDGAGSAMLGAGLFLLFIIGLLIILVVVAVRSSNRNRKDVEVWNSGPRQNDLKMKEDDREDH